MKTNQDTKLAVMGLRRKNEARTRIGQLLFSMFRQNIDRIHGVRTVRSLLRMDSRTLNRHIGFRIYPQNVNEKHILHLDTEDMEVIGETFKIFQVFRRLDGERQRIAHYIFLHLIKHG